MALEEKDTSEPVVSLSRDTKVTDIVFHRNDSLTSENPANIPIEVHVVCRVTVDGREKEIVKRLTQSQVNAGWPGTAKTLKNHLFAIIDAAE
jgi:hypothetical protein